MEVCSIINTRLLLVLCHPLQAERRQKCRRLINVIVRMSFEEQAYANQRHSYDIIAACVLIVLLPSYFIFTSIPPSNHILSIMDVQSSVRKPIKSEEVGQSLMSSFLLLFLI